MLSINQRPRWIHRRVTTLAVLTLTGAAGAAVLAPRAAADTTDATFIATLAQGVPA